MSAVEETATEPAASEQETAQTPPSDEEPLPEDIDYTQGGEGRTVEAPLLATLPRWSDRRFVSASQPLKNIGAPRKSPVQSGRSLAPSAVRRWPPGTRSGPRASGPTTSSSRPSTT